jgi:hypothetical protein
MGWEKIPPKERGGCISKEEWKSFRQTHHGFTTTHMITYKNRVVITTTTPVSHFGQVSSLLEIETMPLLWLHPLCLAQSQVHTRQEMSLLPE